MIRYIHGSQDSTDLDVIYVFEEMPSPQECQQFAASRKDENVNIITLRDGIVSTCQKGHTDEVNNALYHTYAFHSQDYPLMIRHPVPRDVFLKDITVTRKILSVMTRSPLRPQIKAALRGDWQTRLQVLRSLNFTCTDDIPVRGRELQDVVKSMAFSMGQAMGLHDGVELYTKAEIAEYLPALEPYLYRKSSDLAAFQAVLTAFLAHLSRIPVHQNPNGTVTLTETGAVYDIHTEHRIG